MRRAAISSSSRSQGAAVSYEVPEFPAGDLDVLLTTERDDLLPPYADEPDDTLPAPWDTREEREP